MRGPLRAHPLPAMPHPEGLTPFPPHPQRKMTVGHLAYVIARTLRAPLGETKDVDDDRPCATIPAEHATPRWRPDAVSVYRSRLVHPNMGRLKAWVQVSCVAQGLHQRWAIQHEGDDGAAVMAAQRWAASLAREGRALPTPMAAWGAGCGLLEAYGTVTERGGGLELVSGYETFDLCRGLTPLAGTIARLTLFDGGFEPNVHLEGAFDPRVAGVGVWNPRAPEPRFALTAWMHDRVGREVSIGVEPWDDGPRGQGPEEGAKWIGEARRIVVDAHRRRVEARRLGRRISPA